MGMWKKSSDFTLLFVLVTAFLLFMGIRYISFRIAYGDHEELLTASNIEDISPHFPPKNEPLRMPAYTWAPFSYLDDEGKWTGTDIVITEQILSRMGYEVEWVTYPFARALEEMKTGVYPAMAPCVIGGGREEFIYFSEPVISIFSVLWKKRGDDFSWETYEDLDGRLVGASYYHYGAGFIEAAEEGMFELDMVAAEFPELTHFRKLNQGRTDLFICEINVGNYLKFTYAPEFDDIVPVQKGVGPARPFCFALSRKYFEGREDEMELFVEQFNRHLNNMAASGEREKIFKNYGMEFPLDESGRILFPEAAR